MFNPQQLEGIARKVLDTIPPEMGQAPQALKAQIKAKIQSAMQDMDVVTREEFDTQTAVLAKTRAKLEALEKRLADWETQTRQPASNANEQA
ncbi:MAG: accessory factor UbiK family protein [Thiomicrospira sp.]|uniref:accessory factor UbiK family protein n=1 Tax=Thiomicrospira sp. TaxID=935 RepID=UPI0019E5652D|nr:accessory factor UbiK family protein [Thiomicrospira sp.]MBE0494064.1 accessory factor UbiK family protein [Thiomicrospira sp.]